MRIAVTFENGNVFPHFGRTEQFKIYDVEDGKIVKMEIMSTDGNGHDALAGLLSDWKVDTLICGGIGAGAQTALSEANIQFFGGVSGSADEAVSALFAGNLSYDLQVHCDHHSHDPRDGHHCGADQK